MRHLVFILIVLSPVLLFSQPGQRPEMEFQITGTITDSLTELPVEYASIAVFSMRDSSLASGGITNNKGEFKITVKHPGRYYLTIEFIGYKKIFISPVECRPNLGPLISVGEISLAPSAQSLDGVEIVAEKPLVELSIDKKVINVEKNLTSAGGTALDVLRNVPSVEVDQDGNISLRGSENVTVLIDGRPSTLTGSDRRAVLEQIQASTIESVELITNPSAKYRPDGMVGIINIILKKKKGTGLNTLLSLNAGTNDKYSTSFSLNYSTDKFNVFGSYDFSKKTYFGSGISDITYFDLDDSHYLNQEINTEYGRGSNSFKVGADYYFTAKTTLGASFSYALFNSSHESNTLSWTRSINDSLTSAYRNIVLEDGSRNNMNANINFRQRFKKPKQELLIDLYYSNSDDVDSAFNRLTYLESDFETVSSEIPEWTQTISPTLNTVYNAKVDYVHPFNDSTKLEIGFDGSWRRMNINSEYLNYDFNTQLYSFDTIRSNHFLFDENIQAVYANYSTKIKNWGISLGSRFEMASTNAREADSVDHVRTYNSWYPTGGISYKLSKMQEIQLTYSRRINRPRSRSLNPFVDYGFYPNLRTGNPYLDPEYIHSFELTYAHYSKKGTFMPSVFYKKVSDVMSRYRETLNDSVFLMTWQNYNSATSYGFEMIYTRKLFPWWSANFSGTWYRVEIDGTNVETDITGDSYGWQARVNNQFKFPYDFEMQISAFYNGPRFTGQGTREAFFMSDLALKKSFFNKKLALSFRVRDLFNTAIFRINFGDETYDFNMERRREGRVFWLGLTYKLSGDYKQKNKRRSSDDMGGDDGML